MSARAILQAALAAAVRDGVADLTAVFDAPPVRSALPYAVIEEPVLSDWSAKDWRGFEGRFAVILYDAGERPLRLRAMIAEAENAVAALAPDLGEGWRVAGMLLTRSRIARGAGEGWVAASEFRVRMWREGV